MNRGSGKFSQEEEDAYVEKIMNTKKRLSEVDCKGLTMNELEVLDRSKNYVLPLEIKKRVAEYRKAFKIASPEEERLERWKDEIEFQKNKSDLEKLQFIEEEKDAATPPNTRRKKTKKDRLDETDNFSAFDFQKKFDVPRAVPNSPDAQSPAQSQGQIKEKKKQDSLLSSDMQTNGETAIRQEFQEDSPAEYGRTRLPSIETPADKLN